MLQAMLHEILLSLSGHSSPLLTSIDGEESTPVIFSPSEKALLGSIAHLGELHCRVLCRTKIIPRSHPSSICQAVATSIRATHLAKFQQKVIEVENGILRKDAGSVGAYNIVPLTAIVGEFAEWTRRMEWFQEVVNFIEKDGCTGAQLIDKLCEAAQTGYSDIEDAASHLVRVAETAWLKQSSAWILYGRLLPFGREDYFIQRIGNDPDEYEIRKRFLPAFVNSSTAQSILFIGRSLNHIRAKGVATSGTSLGLLPAHLRLLSHLPLPITSSNLSGVVFAIRQSLSQSALQQLLPLSRITEILSLFHDFFLLGRGEFAVALITEADEKNRSRWRRADNLSYDKREKMADITVKEGEVSAVLTRTWATMFALQNANADEDEQLELARDLIHLNISKSSSPARPPSSFESADGVQWAKTPFNSLLLPVPTNLTLQIPSPLDLFLTASEIQTYSSINAYLLSIRRAHLRLTNLWKATSLRRHHPAPPAPPYGSTTAGRAAHRTLRDRSAARSRTLRSVWATSSAALFLLGEAETYFHGQVIRETWAGFQQWLTGASSRPVTSSSDHSNEDVWVAAGGQDTATANTPQQHSHDPQTLSDAHRRCLNSIATNLLLAEVSFTDPLYQFLQHIDHLVALVARIHSIWLSLDLEADDGVVDAFSDFHKEERDVERQLLVVAAHVKDAIDLLIRSLRDINQNGFDRLLDPDLLSQLSLDGPHHHYVPRKVGKLDRLLMKLDFGAWFDASRAEAEGGEPSSGDEFGDL
ncbi:MAG: hypothetical protein M1818_006193 [Claussenomyces sp. TS43310]|nr:MAG: hypothetical protein M1818_006193 [Claussenomyces sp. TS43310]